eukprot:Blabericola_migrator_1__2083@NODE_1574_length_4259_cov_30_803912_g1029_i0_p3_GENE_NODE_1574_length_4259_cov_30_803912_g1029_i0NODE_1574_length_4259_cov_30_803912_g1029_i0_p3_ORF_typecomplete_len196_score35_11zfC2H2_2/PF12756_7/4e03zfC2H2_2/PF12756_7/5_3e05DUF4764/PF15961_5/3_2e03DUF4764/PF15961_5/0_00019zfC2H2_3rep/PF18868_1/1_4e03zfC2H2_3rep/PF18868_1/0_033zfC2H2_3rep/PF18868_1/0_0058Spt46/PF17734_1/1_8e03Spt46/PF17734_1/0_0026zfUBP/PF02148_19/0_012DUF629/PF04780_12/0_022HalOD2/PF18547_1/0_14_N
MLKSVFRMERHKASTRNEARRVGSPASRLDSSVEDKTISARETSVSFNKKVDSFSNDDTESSERSEEFSHADEDSSYDDFAHVFVKKPTGAESGPGRNGSLSASSDSGGDAELRIPEVEHAESQQSKSQQHTDDDGQKKKRRRAKVSTAQAASTWKCLTCQQVFDSRNKLYKHIAKENHAAYKDVVAKSGQSKRK